MRLFLCLPLLLSCCGQRPAPSVDEVRMVTPPVVSVEDDAASVSLSEAEEPVLPSVSLHRFHEGDTLSSVLGELGLEGELRHDAIVRLDRFLDADRVPLGSEFQVSRGSDGRPLVVCFLVSPELRVFLDFEPALSVRCERAEVSVVSRLADGEITRSLHASLVAAGHPAELAPMLAEVFGSNVDFRRLSQGTLFQVLYEARLLNGEVIGVQRILGARIRHRGKTWQAFLFGDEVPLYYDEQGLPLSGSFLPSPVPGYPISSIFTRRRFHPVLKRNMPHLGTDFAAPYGHPVMATADGVVREARRSRYNGNYVKIEHNATYSTQYLHMSRLAGRMAPGIEVHKGDVIGYVGNTGLASGTHLCYRFWKNGKQVDPRLNRPKQGGGVPAGEGFSEARQEIAAQMGPLLSVKSLASFEERGGVR